MMFGPVLLALSLLFVCAQQTQAQDAFGQFTARLWTNAQARGVTRATFDTAMRGVTPDPRVSAATTRQPEYGRPVGDYLASAVSPTRIARGQMKATEWARTLDAVAAKSGVSREILLALWGVETDYGQARDKWDVFRSLATLAFIKYRDPYFRDELIVAMRIMQDNKFPREKMLASWAGAMGQPQFMPSNVVKYAVDTSGDGKVDIWDNVPDVLGSIGHYMREFKWQANLPWGFEVTIPSGFDLMRSRATFGEWTLLGVTRADGKPFPASGDGVLFFPSGYPGPGFVVTANFLVLKAYNNSDAYALSVGLLADRIRGGAAVKTKWPMEDRPLSRPSRIALQKKLAALGYKVNEFDGHVDFDLRDNIRTEQKKFGMAPDGNPTPALLTRLGIPGR